MCVLAASKNLICVLATTKKLMYVLAEQVRGDFSVVLALRVLGVCLFFVRFYFQKYVFVYKSRSILLT